MVVRQGYLVAYTIQSEGANVTRVAGHYDEEGQKYTVKVLEQANLVAFSRQSNLW